MNILKKVLSIVWLLVVLVLSYCMIVEPELGHIVIVFVIGVGLMLTGIKYLVFYFRMAKHMVGGKGIFYYGVMYLNLGVFTATLFDIPQVYIMLYLLGMCLFFGFISIMRSFEMKKMESHWRSKFVEGLGYIFIAILGMVFIQSMLATSIIYCAGLLYSAIMRIIASFRQTSIVYIQ